MRALVVVLAKVRRKRVCRRSRLRQPPLAVVYPEPVLEPEPGWVGVAGSREWKLKTKRDISCHDFFSRGCAALAFHAAYPTCPATTLSQPS